MRIKAALAAVLLVLGLSVSVLAQQAGGQDSGGGRDRGGRGRNFDPAQWRQQFYDDLKQDLGAKEDEWQVLQPKIEKVTTSSHELRTSGRNFFGSRCDRGDRSSRDRGGDRGASSMFGAPNPAIS